MGFRLSPEAEVELDDIWLYVARESGSMETANRLSIPSQSASGCWDNTRESAAVAMIYEQVCAALQSANT